MLLSKYCKCWVPYLFLIPAGIILILFFFVPFFESFLISFQGYEHDLYNPAWVGVDNYIKLINSGVFRKTLINTFIYLLCAVPSLVVLPLIPAILLNGKLAGTNFYRTAVYIPVVVSIVVAGITWKWLYSENGILNYIVGLFGAKKVGWLTNPDIAIFSVIAVTVWKGIGYYMVIYSASLASVPQELYEAADIDGADIFQKHLAVSIPHIMPAITLVSIISSISAMKVFVEIYIMTGGGPLNSTKTIVYYIYQRAFEHLDPGIASAAGVMLLIIIMGLSFLNIKYFEKDKYING